MRVYTDLYAKVILLYKAKNIKFICENINANYTFQDSNKLLVHLNIINSFYKT